jgi:hypothetical protein
VDGIRSALRSWSKKYREENAEKLKEYSKQHNAKYYRENKERIKAGSSSYSKLKVFEGSVICLCGSFMYICIGSTNVHRGSPRGTEF